MGKSRSNKKEAINFQQVINGNLVDKQFIFYPNDKDITDVDAFKTRLKAVNSWRDWILNDFQPTHFITFNFNNKFANYSGFNHEQRFNHAESMIEKWNASLQAKVLGEKFYQKKKLIDETIPFVLFAQNPSTNLHYHGFCRIDAKNWQGGAPGKLKKFIKYSEALWVSPLDTDKPLLHQSISFYRYVMLGKLRKPVCSGGQLDITPVSQKDNYNWEKIISYGSRDEIKRDNFMKYKVVGVNHNITDYKTTKSRRKIILNHGENYGWEQIITKLPRKEIV